MKWIAGRLTTLLLWAMCMLPASAQTASTDSSPARYEPAYESGASRFGGPTSVGGTLDSDRRSEAMMPAAEQPTRGYFDFKQQVQEKYGLVNPWADFSNLAFSTDPTIPAPTQGLGAAARLMVTPNDYVLGGAALWERSLSAGIGYHTRRDSDLIGLGLNWSRPSSDTLGTGLDDQYTAEIYYRIQVLKTFAITPDFQLLIHPALNPDEDLITVWGVQGQLSF